jgi:hypothetical protein
MEQNQQRRAAGLKDKMPDIQKTLDTVRFLKMRKVGLLFRTREDVMLRICAARIRPNRSYLRVE